MDVKKTLVMLAVVVVALLVVDAIRSVVYAQVTTTVGDKDVTKTVFNTKKNTGV